MQNRYTGDIGDYVKLGILRALAPGYRLGVAWWLYPDQDNGDGRHTGYVNHPERWRHLDPDLFDSLRRIVASGQRHVGALEAAGILPGAIFASEVIPFSGPLRERRQARQKWFARMKETVADADLLFVDPDNGLEPSGFSHSTAKAGKSITLAELRRLSRPGRCLIVYHHQTRRAGGHHAEIEHWADRLRQSGFARVDALRAKPFSPRVFFLLDAPDDVRHRAEQVAERWRALISWHSDFGAGGPADEDIRENRLAADLTQRVKSVHDEGCQRQDSLPHEDGIPKRSRSRGTTQIGYINRHQQEVIRPTGRPGTDHGQYVYVLRCRTCGHEYGANGSDIWLRRCPEYDRGAPGPAPQI